MKYDVCQFTHDEWTLGPNESGLPVHLHFDAETVPEKPGARCLRSWRQLGRYAIYFSDEAAAIAGAIAMLKGYRGMVLDGGMTEIFTIRFQALWHMAMNEEQSRRRHPLNSAFERSVAFIGQINLDRDSDVCTVWPECERARRFEVPLTKKQPDLLVVESLFQEENTL